MNSLQIFEGRPHTPYLVFIRRTGSEFLKLLRELGLKHYRELDKIKYTDSYLCITDDGTWTHLIDCFRYTHWHSSSFKSRVAALAKHSDILTFSVGDTDMYFDLELHLNGEMVRRVVWEDHNYNGGSLKEELGDPILGEEFIPRGQDPIEGLWKLAEAHGIECDYNNLEVRAFAAKDSLIKT